VSIITGDTAGIFQERGCIIEVQFSTPIPMPRRLYRVTEEKEAESE
jgi:hypothetical protein